MDISYSWAAVQGVAREQALEALGMEVSEEQTGLGDGIALFEWSDDWLVILTDDEDAFDELNELGELGRVVTCSVNAEAMYSRATGYEDGDFWSVKVNAQTARITVLGQPPAQLDSIIGEARATQADSDTDLFFAIPAALAQSICGFRLEQADLAAVSHVTLQPAAVSVPDIRSGRRPGFFARLFGRG